MRNHLQIDRRSLALSRAIVAKIDDDDPCRALEHARTVNRRWRKDSCSPLHDQWHDILKQNGRDVRLYPEHNPAAADIIDGAIGDLSPFHELFGYYAHGVGPETAALPRLVVPPGLGR